jgi:hypothetical protein
LYYSFYNDEGDITMEQERVDRFWAKVDIKSQDDCWLWTAGTTSKGYGSFAIAPQKTATAHKIAWALAKNNGVMSDPKDHIMHLCDVKRCVNPNHLELGDAMQNNKDALARGVRVPHRLSERESCSHGHPRTPENTHPKYNTCILCMRDSARKSKERKRNLDRESYNTYHREYYQRNRKESAEN